LSKRVYEDTTTKVEVLSRATLVRARFLIGYCGDA
jgi:hypothetical protein